MQLSTSFADVMKAVSLKVFCFARRVPTQSFVSFRAVSLLRHFQHFNKI